jgi:hypothetical protein
MRGWFLLPVLILISSNLHPNESFDYWFSMPNIFINYYPFHFTPSHFFLKDDLSSISISILLRDLRRINPVVA